MHCLDSLRSASEPADPADGLPEYGDSRLRGEKGKLTANLASRPTELAATEAIALGQEISGSPNTDAFANGSNQDQTDLRSPVPEY